MGTQNEKNDKQYLKMETKNEVAVKALSNNQGIVLDKPKLVAL